MRRLREPEIMDDPLLSPTLHVEALQGLASIHRFTGTASILWPPIFELAKAAGGRMLRVLDVATGGGTLPVALWRKARQHGIELDVSGCDVSRVALKHAELNAQVTGASVTFFQHDVLTEPLPRGYDIVVCSLFLHHLDDVQGRILLKQMADVARQLLLVHDLLRTRLGLLMVYVGTRLLSRSPVVHNDGPASVRAAYTLAEMQALAKLAGLDGATIASHWTSRYLLSWSPADDRLN